MGIREVVNLIKLIQTAGEGNCAVVVRYVSIYTVASCETGPGFG
jgi:hypothetical protein